MKNIQIILIALSIVGLAERNCFSQNIGINTTGNTPDVSAMLDIVASDKGLLLPRVSLTSNTDVSTISGTEANSLIVFNTNGSMSNGNGKGYYYWDLPTLKWIYLAAASNGPGTIGQVLTSQGNGNNPQWTNPGSTGGGGGATGCAACITEISTTEWSNITWTTCRNNCRTLVENGSSDWRIPTFDELVYYTSGTFDPPDGSWLPDYVWTSTPTDSRVLGTEILGDFMVFYESTGQWNYSVYNSATRACRCVR